MNTLPDELVRECIDRVDKIGIWMSQFVCKRFHRVISAVITPCMRTITPLYLYQIALLSENPQFVDFVKWKKAGAIDDISIAGVVRTYNFTIPSITVLEKFQKYGIPITLQILYKTLSSPNAPELFEWFEKHAPYVIPDVDDKNVIIRAVENLDNLKYFYGRGYTISPAIWDKALCAPATHDWLRSIGIPYSTTCFNIAAKKGDIRMVKHLVSSGVGFDGDIGKTAVACANLNVVKWVHENGCPLTGEYIVDTAIICGNADIVKYLLDAGNQWNAHATQTCIVYGRDEIFEWAFGSGLITRIPNIVLTPRMLAICESAGIYVGPVSAMRSMMQAPPAVFRDAFVKLSPVLTAENVQYLYEHAFEYDRLAHVKILHSYGNQKFPYNVKFAMSVPTIEWLYDVFKDDLLRAVKPRLMRHPCELVKFLFHRGDISAADIRSEKFDIINRQNYTATEFALSVGVKFVRHDFVRALNHCSYEYCVFLHDKITAGSPNGLLNKTGQRGTKSRDDICSLATYRGLPYLKWVHFRGYPLTDQVLAIACINNNYDMVMWLHKQNHSFARWNIEPADNCVHVINETTLTHHVISK